MSFMATPYRHDDAVLIVKLSFNNCNYEQLTPEQSNNRLNMTLRDLRFKCQREVKNTFIEPLLAMDYEGKKASILNAIDRI